MRRTIIRPHELTIVYALVGGIPALYLSVWAAFLVYFDVVALITGHPEQGSPMPFYWHAGGLAATISGTLLLLGIGVNSWLPRIAHVMCLSLGVFVGLSWAWMFRGPGAGMAAWFGFLPAVVGVALIGHLIHDAQQGAPGDGPRPAGSARA